MSTIAKIEAYVWSVNSGYIPDQTLTLSLKELNANVKDGGVLRTNHPLRDKKE